MSLNIRDRKILKGSRINLVLLEKKHLSKRVEFINDPEVQATLNFDYPTSIARTEAWFNKNVLATNRIDFAIENSDHEVVGFVGYINIDRFAGKAEHYIFLGKTYWSEGYGREAYKLLTNYGFLEMGLNRLYGYQLNHNEKAHKLTTSLGWTVEGFLRDDVYSHGELKGRQVIAILRDEWADNTMYDEV